MQVFITSSDPEECASNLDTRRLLKQVVEAHQVINAIHLRASGAAEKGEGKTPGWVHHPATKMWAPHLGYLKLLKNAFIAELKKRKTKNGADFKLNSDVFSPYDLTGVDVTKPAFMDDDSILRMHRGNLLRKAAEAKAKGNADDHKWYSRFGWKDPQCYGYVWCIGKERHWSTLLKKPMARDPRRTRMVPVTYLVQGPEHTIVREITPGKIKKAKSKAKDKDQDQDQDESEVEKKEEKETEAEAEETKDEDKAMEAEPEAEADAEAEAEAEVEAESAKKKKRNANASIKAKLKAKPKAKPKAKAQPVKAKRARSKSMSDVSSSSAAESASEKGSKSSSKGKSKGKEKSKGQSQGKGKNAKDAGDSDGVKRRKTS